MAVSESEGSAVVCDHEVSPMRTADPPMVMNALRPSAVAWIDDRHALVATNSMVGSVTVTEIRPMGDTTGPDETYLVRVVDAIGDRQHVAILGPDSLRLALEREYVLIFRRPDRLIDVERSTVMGHADIVDRLRVLASA
jgi:hypothetical protein